MPDDLSFNNELLEVLYKKWKGQPLFDSEQALLDKWRISSAYNEEMVQALPGEWVVKNLTGWKRKNAEQIWNRSRTSGYVRPINIHYLKSAWLRYAAAAILLLAVGVYCWNYKIHIKNEKSAIVKKATLNNEVLTAGIRATLSLADGTKIILEDAQPGTLAQQIGAAIVKRANGEIVYTPQTISQVGDVAFNTMTTPRGGQYKLILPDGTKVWLDAASSITYPTAFVGKDRAVSITGEVYFEVAKDIYKSFHVKTRTDEITVLGTHFNINAYEEERNVKTSLLEGSLKIMNNVLRPGQAYSNGKIIPTNVQQDVAWKNGAFYFKATDLTSVLRQLSRWYDVEVVFEGNISSKTISGKMGRDLSLSQVLDALKGMGINYKMNGRVLIILPDKSQ